jgi:hypothetical protein
MKKYVYSDFVHDDIVRLLEGIEKAVNEHKDEPYYVIGYLQTWIPFLRRNVEECREENEK